MMMMMIMNECPLSQHEVLRLQHHTRKEIR